MVMYFGLRQQNELNALYENYNIHTIFSGAERKAIITMLKGVI